MSVPQKTARKPDKVGYQKRSEGKEGQFGHKKSSLVGGCSR